MAQGGVTESQRAVTLQLFEKFVAAMKSPSPDLNSCNGMLAQLKVQLTQFSSLPPFFDRTATAQQDLLLARTVLEHAVYLSIQMKDEAAFERHFLQLKMYYLETRSLDPPLPPSEQLYPILGLNLLRLLVQNRTAEFHTELELLPADAQRSPFVRHPIELEQFLMEGAYGRLLAARARMPDASYGYFMDKLMSTVRDEVASSSEKAYESLRVPDAVKMMFFSSGDELQLYATQRGWDIRDNTVYFSPPLSACSEIPSLQLINHALSYAKELERIV
eukprot:jgi/Mesvir1/10752/Mv13821-RA.1